MKNWKLLLAALSLAGISACATAGSGHEPGSMTEAPPGGDYQPVSELVPLPEFIPGLGSLYVQPETLPAGPFLAYNRDRELVSTIYMIPLDALNEHTEFKGLEAIGQKTVQVDMYYNAGHPGVAEPHYHVVLWHVSPAQAGLK